MTTHEAFVLGWIWGAVEATLPDYDPRARSTQMRPGIL